MPKSNTTAKAVILADGEYPADGVAGDILRAAKYVVCCDGAADSFILNGGTPAAIVGDCDSMSEITMQCYPDIIHRSESQEDNDLTKAFRYCVSQGKNEIIILGATGRREDHSLANISLLADYALEADVCMVTNNGVFNAIREDSKFASFIGQQVSIFTIDTTTAITVEGLLYTPPADGLCAWWRGSLNEAVKNNFIIHTNGRTLVFRTF